MINVFMSCNDAYVPHLCQVMASAVANASAPIHFRVVSAGLCETSRANIQKTVEHSDCVAEFVTVDASRFSGVGISLKHLSVEIFFRYYLAEICPQLDKAIYLDCDVVVLGDLAELYNTDLDNLYAAVVEDYAKVSYVQKLGLEKYFNSGVMLFNLAKMRSDGIPRKLFELTSERAGEFKYQDQDVLNIVLRDGLKFLPPRWNASAPLYRKNAKSLFGSQEVERALLSPSVVHFTGPDKPWKIPFGIAAHPYAPAYFYYLSKTPYAHAAQEFSQNFAPLKNFKNYILRHPGLFFRPRYWKMRMLYKSNLEKFSVNGE